jgi:hypothetical protein
MKGMLSNHYAQQGKKVLEEMTADERMQKIPKMSYDELCYLLEVKHILTPQELEAVYSELERRDGRIDKFSKVGKVISVASLLIVGAIDLFGNLSQKS